MNSSQQLRSQSDYWLEEARALVVSGALPSELSFTAEPYRRGDGGFGLDLVAREAGCASAWHFTPSSEETFSTLQSRLVKEHEYWRRAVTLEAIEAMRSQLEDFLLVNESVSLDAWGISTPSRWHDRYPGLVMFLNCRGANGKEGRERLVALHQQGLAEDLERISMRQRQAEQAVAEWERIDAVGAVDSVAAAIMDECGVKPWRTAQELETAGASALPVNPHGLSGAFRWSDLRIQAFVEAPKGWRLDGQVLTLPTERLALSMTMALEGLPLSRLIEIEGVPLDTIMERFPTSHSGKLTVVLRPEVVPIREA